MGDLFDLRGKVAVITGSTKGIGKAMAERMAEHGAKVVISSRKADVCDEVAAAINAKGGEAIAIPCNISDQSQLEVLVNKTVAAWGGIDILVCNAAANPYYGPMADVPEAAYDKTMENKYKKAHRVVWVVRTNVPMHLVVGVGLESGASFAEPMKGGGHWCANEPMNGGPLSAPIKPMNFF